MGSPLFTLAPCDKPAEEAVPCVPAPASLKYNESCTKKKKKDNTMSRYYDDDLDAFVETPQTDLEKSRSWLRGRVSSVYSTQWEKIRRQFGLLNDPTPQSFAELQDRLAAGKFIIPDDRKNKESYDPLNYVEWRDPAIKKDEPGFKLADIVLDAAKTAAYDAVNTADPAAGLAAVQAFEKWTYTATA